MNKRLIFVGVIVLMAVTLACGSGSQVIGTVDPNAQKTPVSIQTYQVGDVIQVDTHTITLNSAQIIGGMLQANFTVENTGSDSTTVSSLMSFEAKGDDGTKLEMDIFDCPSGSLDGTVLAGDKLKGNVCWSGVTTDSAKIYYTPNFLGDVVVVWVVAK